MNDSARLASIRDQLAAIAPGDWQLAFDGEGGLLDALGPRGERVMLARFAGIATADEMRFAADAVVNVRFLLDLVDRAARKVRELSPPADPFPGRCLTGDEQREQGGRCGCRGADDMCPCQNVPDAPTRRRWAADGHELGKNYAAEASIKCGEPAFKKFLMERHGLESPATTERAAQKLRSLLGVGSRAELNHDADAAAAWRSLRGDFEAWRRVGA